jgi:hypothetical protein
MTPGMVAVFAPNTPSTSGLGGVVLRRQPNFIEVVMGNVANRVVITCIRESRLAGVRRPAAVQAAAKPAEPLPKGE